MQLWWAEETLSETVDMILAADISAVSLAQV